jgi:hypothetical protein
VTYPHTPQPGPRPGPPPGGFRPGPPPQPHGFRPEQPQPQPQSFPPETDVRAAPAEPRRADGGTGHPAVDAVLQSLANAARLAPADQIAEYEAAHHVLQETLTSIDG